MAILATWLGEGLSNGVPVSTSTAGTGDTAFTTVTSGAFTTNTGQPSPLRIQGDQAGGSAAELVWGSSVVGTSLTAWSTRFYVKISGIPSANGGRLLSAYTASTTLIWFADLNTSGNFRLRNAGGSAVSTSASTLPTDTLLRIEAVHDNGAVTVNIYLGHSTTVFTSVTSTGLGTGVGLEAIRYVMPATSPTWPSLWVGGFAAADTAAEIGPISGGTTPVSAQAVSGWNVQQTVGADVGAAWHVRQLVPATGAVAWNTRSSVTRSASSAWQTRSARETVFSAAWGVRAPVVRQTSMAWDVSDEILLAVSVSVTGQWEVRDLVTASRESSWHVRQGGGSATVTARWSLRARRAVFGPTGWMTRQQAHDSTSADWHVRVPVATGTELAWTVRRPVTSSQGSRWRVRRPIVAARPLRWSLRQRPAKTQAVAWTIRSRTSAQQDLAWHTLQLISRPGLAAWGVRARPGRAAPVGWRTLHRADPAAAGLSWRVRIARQMQSGAVWHQRARDAAHGEVTWMTRDSASRQAELGWDVRPFVHDPDVPLLRDRVPGLMREASRRYQP